MSFNMQPIPPKQTSKAVMRCYYRATFYLLLSVSFAILGIALVINGKTIGYFSVMGTGLSIMGAESCIKAGEEIQKEEDLYG
jgi:hypothetical protein